MPFCSYSSILENCEDLKSTRPIACELKVVQQDAVVINVWVCQEVGMAIYKMFTFLLLFMQHVARCYSLETCELHVQ